MMMIPDAERRETSYQLQEEKKKATRDERVYRAPS